ncbi:Bifunctional uridylyltransferase/uridylyl-removing enzyme OS=Stutzerimonas stutzeri OX=316 GN=glnD PE=3 SV=1 [Stutzerimonas stutzeri]
MAEKYPLASALIERLPKPELIYIAGLYHDIAKGRGGDHSSSGAVDAKQFCNRHKLPAWDTRLVVWLVQNHLGMSTTAQRKDLSDPQVIIDFAQQVGDETHLDYLYVLTVADINATNPTLWNSWRASLLRQLHTATQRALQRGLENPLGREEQIRQEPSAPHWTNWCAMAATPTRPSSSGRNWVTTISCATRPATWPGIPRRSSRTVKTTARWADQGNHAARIRGRHAECFIYAPDQRDFFAVTVAAMDQLNLNIHDARIITSSSQFTLDTYIVLDADGTPIGDDRERIEEIRQGLIDAVRNPDEYLTIIQRYGPRQLKHFAFPPQVTIHNDTQRPQTIIEIIAPDRPGLLARVGQLFLAFDLSVQNAKIATLGERVEDVFFVTNADNQPLSDPQLCTQLQQALIAQLQQENEHQPSPSSFTI